MDVTDPKAALPLGKLVPFLLLACATAPTHAGTAAANGTVRAVVEFDSRVTSRLSDAEWASLVAATKATVGTVATDGDAAVVTQVCLVPVACKAVAGDRRHIYVDIDVTGLAAGSYVLHVAAGLASDVVITVSGKSQTWKATKQSSVVSGPILATISA